MGNGRIGIKQYFAKGLTTFLVVAASIAFFFFIFRFSAITAYINQVISILKPIIYGAVIAYLLNPIMLFFEKHFYKLFSQSAKNKKSAQQISRGLGIFFALIAAVAILILLGMIIIPELFSSISGMIRVVPGQIDQFVTWFTEMSKADTELGAAFQETVRRATEYLENWMQTDLLNDINLMISGFTQGVMGVFNVTKNLVIGFIVSIYILNGKETFTGQAKKALYAIFSKEHANVILETARESHRIFGGFISGKLVDSLIVGIICFFVLSLFQMPYTMLVSVIVGVTNVIPFFGPYIGAIPSAILILLVSPKQGIIFIVIIIILQQLDGNIIGPKILGQSTGLSAFWVIFAILLGGGLFGLVGMIIGVPTFAVVYHIVKSILRYRLNKKDLPIDSAEYIQLDKL